MSMIQHSIHVMESQTHFLTNSAQWAQNYWANLALHHWTFSNVSWSNRIYVLSHICDIIEETMTKIEHFWIPHLIFQEACLSLYVVCLSFSTFPEHASEQFLWHFCYFVRSGWGEAFKSHYLHSSIYSIIISMVVVAVVDCAFRIKYRNKESRMPKKDQVHFISLFAFLH